MDSRLLIHKRTKTWFICFLLDLIDCRKFANFLNSANGACGTAVAPSVTSYGSTYCAIATAL